MACPICEGDGWVVHPAWREYWATHRRLEENYEEWFRARGYETPPPEEIPCECTEE